MFETTNQLFLYIIFPIGDDPSDLMFISFSLQRFRKSQIPIFDKLRYDTGWWFQPLGKILVSWGYYSQYMEK